MSFQSSLFNIHIGCYGIAWSVRGIVGVRLPEIHIVGQTSTRLMKLFLQHEAVFAVAARVHEAIAWIKALPRRNDDSLRSITPKMSLLMTFNEIEWAPDISQQRLFYSCEIAMHTMGAT